jgi:hypothetical protein
MDPLKVQAILDWPVPRNVKDVQTFLGFTNFYQHFIEKYTARILSKLTGKNQWTWHEEQLDAFDKLHLSFGDGSALHMVQVNGRFKIEVDSSGYANGGVLYQWQNDKWVTIAFRSTVLGPAERNYGIEDRELLAIIVALKDWRQYLLSTNKPFEIWTDHANLQYFKDPQKVNRRQARWLTILSEYYFTLHHFPGKQNVRADALSRRPDYDEGENDNENVTILPEHLFRALVDADQTLMEMIESSQRKNRSKDKVGLNGFLLNSKGLVENCGRIFIPYDIELIEEIHPVFNEVLLTLFVPPAFPGQVPPPPPPLINMEGHPKHEVDSVVRVRKRPRRPPCTGPHPLQYLVHWRGYTHEEDTWQFKEDLTNAPEAIADFYIKNPTALRLLLSSSGQRC